MKIFSSQTTDRRAHSPRTWGLRLGRGGFTIQTDGPFPRMWGLPPDQDCGGQCGRSIPTHVGFTNGTSMTVTPTTVHSYVREVYRLSCTLVPAPIGPSPRTWGLPPDRAQRPSFVSVHPHVRGVCVRPALVLPSTLGSSPRAWGLPCPPGPETMRLRSIPTCVGVTPSACTFSLPSTVHPHVCGGYGLGVVDDAFSVRSIPTHAGFTIDEKGSWQPAPVHPHPCGVYTEIKLKISRVSSKTSFLPAEKFKILFLVKIKSSAAAFQVHTIFRDQSPPGLHFEIALHL